MGLRAFKSDSRAAPPNSTAPNSINIFNSVSSKLFALVYANNEAKAKTTKAFSIVQNGWDASGMATLSGLTCSTRGKLAGIYPYTLRKIVVFLE